MALVKEMFKHAVQWGYLDTNPAQYVEQPRVEVEEMEILTPPEMLDAADEPVRTMLLCGKLLGLKWEDASAPQSSE